MANGTPSRDDGVVIRIHTSRGGDAVWMVKRAGRVPGFGPGVYFREPEPGKPIVYVDDDTARAAGFDVDADRRAAKIEERVAAARAKAEQEVRAEELRAASEKSPPFLAHHRGGGTWGVIDSRTQQETAPDERLTKAQAEELAAKLVSESLARSLASAGIDPQTLAP